MGTVISELIFFCPIEDEVTSREIYRMIEDSLRSNYDDFSEY